jgi:hypothetical protein
MSRPSGTSRSTRRSSIQRQLSLAHQRLVAQTRHLTGADSEMMKKAAGVLQKHIRRRLSTSASRARTALRANARGHRRMYGDPSAPGESPRKLTGALARGIKNTVVDGVRVVRAENFKSKIHEFGFVAPATAAGTYTRGKKKGQLRPARAARSQAPRPFLRPGLEDAKPEMAKVGASVLTAGVRASAGGLGG